MTSNPFIRAAAILPGMIFLLGWTSTLHLIGKYPPSGPAIDIGLPLVRISLSLPGDACQAGTGGKRMTLYLRGIRARADPQSVYRVYLQGADRARDELTGASMVGEFNFYGIGAGMRRDLNFELDPGDVKPAKDHAGGCVAHVLLAPVHPIQPDSAPSIDSIELWGD